MIEGLLGFAFVFVICCYAVKNAVTDSMYAVRGQIPPRVKLRMAELQKTGKLRYGLWDYLRDLWHDSLEDRRKAREARRKDPHAGKGPMRRFFSQWWEKRWGDAWDRYLNKASKKAKRRKEAREGDAARADGTTKPVAADDRRPQRWTNRLGDWFRDLFKVRIATGANGDDADGTEDGRHRPTTAGAVVDPAPATTASPGHGSTPPDPFPRPAPAPAGTDPGGRPMATVIPMFRGGNTMADAPEVTGLGSAQQYASGMSEAFANQVPATETFIATLQGHGVSGEVIAAAAAAQEASNDAAAAWAQADQALIAHGGVKEAYDANPGAGSKEFVTAE